MREQTTRDLGKYVAKASVNMPADVPLKHQVTNSAVWSMCERCGTHTETVRLHWRRAPKIIGPRRQWTLCDPCWERM